MTAMIVGFGLSLMLAASIAYTGKLGFLARDPRSHWLSAASGVTIGYVFLGLLPKLQRGYGKVKEEVEGPLPFLEDHIYFVALIGMLVFYALAIATHVSRKQGTSSTASGRVLAATIALFGLYVFLLGELVAATAEKDLAVSGVLTAALVFHFAGSDFGLRTNHDAAYVRYARWILAAAAIAGWAAGVLFAAPPGIIAVASAFLAGAIITNVLYDELPDEEHAHFVPFAIGALASGLLLATIG